MRQVLTHKQALERLAKVQKEVAKGNMGVTAACKKHKFPIYKYSYWKKVKEESDALDAMIDENNKEDGFETLYDSSPVAIRKMAKDNINLVASIKELEVKLESVKRERDKLKEENVGLKDKLLEVLLKS